MHLHLDELWWKPERCHSELSWPLGMVVILSPPTGFGELRVVAQGASGSQHFGM